MTGPRCVDAVARFARCQPDVTDGLSLIEQLLEGRASEVAGRTSSLTYTLDELATADLPVEAAASFERIVDLLATAGDDHFARLQPELAMRSARVLTDARSRSSLDRRSKPGALADNGPEAPLRQGSLSDRRDGGPQRGDSGRRIIDVVSSTSASPAPPTAVLDRAALKRLGSDAPVVAITQADAPTKGWHGKRILTLDGAAAFEMSFWCGICPLVFQRLEGANRTLSVDSLTQQLDDGLNTCDEVVAETIGANLQEGDYLPVLLEVHPQLVFPSQVGDYFCEEQVATWGIDPFWGLPENPRTPYYRTPSRVVSADASLFEFIVPLVPPSWNDVQRVTSYVDRLAQSSMPTCVALSVLDVRQQADWDTPEEGLVHWGLTHYLLDGHHKMEAAARSRRGLRMLSLVAMEQSLARPEELERLPTLLANAPVRPGSSVSDVVEP